MGFFDSIKKALKINKKQEKQKREQIKTDISSINKRKLPKKQKTEYKVSEKKLTKAANYHHIVKIYYVIDDIRLDDDLLSLMIEFVKIWIDRVSDDDLIKKFRVEFDFELNIDIITLASNKKRLTIKELWKFAQEFLDSRNNSETSLQAFLVGLKKIGLVKNELSY